MILSIIILTVIIQSIFGVGVLLFGTPLLLLTGYDFISTLSIVLPISIVINLIQIISSYKKLDLLLLKNFFLFTIPIVIISLIFIVKSGFDINLIIGLFVIFSSLSYFSIKIKTILNYLLKYEKTYLLLMGVIHGLSNLGGALLTPYINHKFHNKISIRVNIALLYMTLAIFQLITITLINANNLSIHFDYIIIAIIVYLVVNKLLFHKINEEKYKKIFYYFLFISGMVLILKGLL